MSSSKSKKPTSFDVAKRAGVDRSVVSRALAGTGRVSEETRARVKKAARELGYHVDFLARGLQTGSSRLVGLVASRLDTPFRANQVRLTAKQLIEHGYIPILITAEGETSIEGLIQLLLNYNVAGVIITSDTPSKVIVDECARLQVPVILVNRRRHTENADSVELDSIQSAKMALQVLTDGGAHRFGVIRPKKETYSVTGRANAFLNECKAKGLPVQVLQTEQQEYEDGLFAAELFAQSHRDLDAVFTTTDLLGLGFLDGVKNLYQIAVPGQVQVLGFDDIAQSSWLSYNLSTLKQNNADIVESAIRLLLARVETPKRDYQRIALMPEVVLRETTKVDR